MRCRRELQGRQHYWKSGWLTDLTDGAIDVMLEFLATKPSPATGIGLQQLHGAAARVDAAARIAAVPGELIRAFSGPGAHDRRKLAA